MGELSHFDAGGASRMVDVGDKPVSRRLARASGRRADGRRDARLDPRAAWRRRETCSRWPAWPASWPPSGPPT